MRIGGLIKQSLIDWEGRVTAVIFTQGCNFPVRLLSQSLPCPTGTFYGKSKMDGSGTYFRFCPNAANGWTELLSPEANQPFNLTLFFCPKNKKVRVRHKIGHEREQSRPSPRTYCRETDRCNCHGHKIRVKPNCLPENKPQYKFRIAGQNKRVYSYHSGFRYRVSFSDNRYSGFTNGKGTGKCKKGVRKRSFSFTGVPEWGYLKKLLIAIEFLTSGSSCAIQKAPEYLFFQVSDHLAARAEP